MAAPTFVGAGAGAIIQTGSAAVTAAGSGVAVGDLVILQVLQDGVAASAVTYSAISGIADLAGTASSLTTLATAQPCGTLALQHLRVGRATSTTCSVTAATTGDDLYCRLYVFRNVNSGAALTDILENGTAGTIANGSGATAAITDTAVVTLDADRLAVQFVGVDDDNPLAVFTGMTGGTWAEPVAEFASATGTDAAIQLQTGETSWSTHLANTGTSLTFGGGTTNQRAQKFVAPATATLNTVRLRLTIGGTPTDDVSVRIETDSGGLPSGVAVGSTVNVDVTTPQVYTVSGLGAALTSGTSYWIVVGRTGALSASNLYGWNNATTSYAAGTNARYDITSTTWVAVGGTSSFALDMPGPGTIDGGTQTMAAADNWGVIGFALKPVPAVSGTNWTQPVDDTLSLADSATTQTGKSATIGDTITLADATSSAAVFARTVPDTLTLADSQAFQRDVALPLADTLTLADLVAAQRGIAQAVADTLTLADLASTAAGKGVTLADTLALADSLSSAGVFQRAIADTLNLADTIAAQSAFQLSIADTLALADALSLQAAFVRALADTLTLADLADPVKGVGGVDHTQPIADTLALADALTAGSTLARAVADTLALADSLTAQKAIVRELADTFSLADAVRFGRVLGLADTVALADAVSFQAAYLRTLADTLSLADSVTAGRQLAQALADMLALIDAIAFESGRGLLLADTLALADLLETLFTGAIGEQPPAGTITFPSLGGLTRASRGPRITQPTHGARTRADRGKTDTPRGGVLTKTARGDVT